MKRISVPVSQETHKQIVALAAKSRRGVGPEAAVILDQAINTAPLKPAKKNAAR